MVVLATGLPLGCEVVFERGVRYSLGCNKSSSVEVPWWEYSGLEILLSEGGDVELRVRTSEHILVLAFDPLTLTLSLSLSLSLSLYICTLHH